MAKSHKAQVICCRLMAETVKTFFITAITHQIAANIHITRGKQGYCAGLFTVICIRLHRRQCDHNHIRRQPPQIAGVHIRQCAPVMPGPHHRRAQPLTQAVITIQTAGITQNIAAIVKGNADPADQLVDRRAAIQILYRHMRPHQTAATESV